MSQAPIVIDVEASGFGSNSYPIEVGVALENGQTQCYLLSPLEEWRHWDREAERLHGLTRNQLLAFGKPLDEVATGLNQLLGCNTVYSDAWGYDQSWIALLFDAAGMLPTFRIDHILSLMDEHQLSLWDDARAEVETKLALERHRASADAKIIQQTYLRTRQMLCGEEASA